MYGPLLEQANAEIRLAMQVALLINHEYSRAEIAEALKVSPGDVRAAVARLKKISPQIDRDDD